MVETISELTRLASELNEQSNNLNALITSLNEKLGAMNFGLETWNYETIAGDNYKEDYDDDGRLVDKYRRASELGYAKVEDVWQLAVREVTRKVDLESPGEYEYSVNVEYPSPLLKASREARIRALPLVRTLLDRLRDEAKDLLNAIAEGKKLAVKLGK